LWRERLARPGLQHLAGRGGGTLDPHAPVLPVPADRPHGRALEDVVDEQPGRVPPRTPTRLWLAAIPGRARTDARRMEQRHSRGAAVRVLLGRRPRHVLARGALE